MPGCSDTVKYSRCPGAIPQHRITPRDAEAGADPTAARGAPRAPLSPGIPYLSPEPTPGAALSPPQCPRSPFPTPLPSAPPPRVMSAQPGPRSLPSAPSTPRSRPSHPAAAAAAAASLPSVATATAGESHPLLLHLPGPRLVSTTAALPRDRGEDRATAGDKQQGAASDGFVARHTWKGRKSRGSQGKRAQSKQALTLPAAVSPELFPPSHSLHSSLPGSSLFLSPTCSLLRGCAHEHRDGTNSPQTSLQRLLLDPTSRSEIRLLIRNSSPAPNQTIRSRWAHYH